MSREQQTIRYVATFCATVGEGTAYLDPRPAASGPILFGVPRWRWRRLIELWLRYRFHRWVPPFLRLVGALTGLLRCLGYDPVLAEAKGLMVLDSLGRTGPFGTSSH